ncbi:PREDICTED: probable DNA-binding protein SNT1 [Rhagoletis zephyria]|uniref:probable DNA-binding protein SNT1 n=1 Tax=Rhagoletis zephyria TaxID=28612 RepID=UPI0008118EDB|nr:PREDICTED: probable DNA-binding protein SNT1 [Rhagoletis zephyria]
MFSGSKTIKSRCSCRLERGNKNAHIKTAATDLKEQHGSLNKISQRLDKIYDIQKKHYKEMESHLKEVNLIKKEKIEEMKRHNYVMEKMRRKEIEYKLEKNRRLMEIEDLKVRKSNDGQMQCD